VELSVIVPCFNESTRVASMLKDISRWAHTHGRSIEIVVVDDASTDGTPDVVRKSMETMPEVRLIQLERHAGKGGTVRAGMRAALGGRRCFVDADGAFTFEDIDRLEGAMDAGADVVVGSRLLTSSQAGVVPWYRRLASACFRALVRRLLVRSVGDTQCGFKLFRDEAAVALFSEQHVRGFAFDVEVLQRAEQAGLRIVEVPVRCRRRIGSNIRVVRDGIAMTVDVLRLYARRGRRQGIP
jgi:dolichyl-phosphate beta-glucosyltransferase